MLACSPNTEHQRLRSNEHKPEVENVLFDSGGLIVCMFVFFGLMESELWFGFSLSTNFV